MSTQTTTRPKQGNTTAADRLYTYEEAAKFTGVSEITLRRLVSHRKLRHLKIGRSVRFTKQMLIDDHDVPANVH